MNIDDLIHEHWGDTIVLRGETPEDYAIRREGCRRTLLSILRHAVREGHSFEDTKRRFIWILETYAVQDVDQLFSRSRTSGAFS